VRGELARNTHYGHLRLRYDCVSGGGGGGGGGGGTLRYHCFRFYIIPLNIANVIEC